MADIRLAKPAAGTTQTVPSAPDGRFIFDFPADAATLTRSGDNLVLTFEDGASIQLQDFYTTYSKEEMPSFQVEGVEISGQDFFAALGEDLMPAAGPAAGSSASRSGRYNEYGGSDLLDGLDHLGRLDIGFDGGVQLATDTVEPSPYYEDDHGVTVTPSAPGTDPDDPDIPVQGEDFPPTMPHDVLQVDESALDGGSGGGSATADGSMSVSAPDGVATITIGGVVVWQNGVLTGNPVQTDEGHLDVTGFDGTNLTYTYTLDKATQEHGKEGGGENDAIAHEMEVVVTDSDGDSGSAVIRVEITDDVPTIESFGYDVTEGSSTVINGDALAGSAAGADGADFAWTNPAQQGQYGTITLNPNGSYSYTLDNDNAAVKELSKDETLTEEFTYTYTDADGDVATGKVTITINGVDNGVVVTPSDPEAGSETLTVHESGLADGSTPGAAPTTAEGSLTISAPDGVSSIVIGNVTVFEDGKLTGNTVSTDEGVLTVTAFDAATGKLSFSYELKDNTTEHDGTGKDNVSHDLTVTVTDVDGTEAGSTITVTIVDDVPTAQADSVSFTEAQAQAGGSGENVLTNDVFGADAPADKTVTSIEGGTLGQPVKGEHGTLTLNSDGTYTYQLTPGVDVPKDATYTETFTYTITDTDGDTSEATLTISITGDGNEPVVTVETPEGSEADIVVDEGSQPEHGGAGHGQSGNGSFTVQLNGEDGVITVGGENGWKVTVTGENANVTGSVVTVNGVEVKVTGATQAADGSWTVSYDYELTAPQTHGSDGSATDDSLTGSIDISVTDATGDTAEGTLTVQVHDDVPTIESFGHSVTEGSSTVINGDALEGSAAGADGASFAWTNPAQQGQYGEITLNADGSYSYTLDNDNPEVKALSNNQKLEEVFTYTYTDADGDIATGSVLITINGVDNGVVVTPSDPEAGSDKLTVYESGLADGSNPGGAPTTAEGSLSISAPDGVASIKIDGVTVFESGALTNNTVPTNEGVLTVTGFDAATGKLQFTYELTGNTTEHDGTGKDNISHDLAVTVTDMDGTTAGSTITVTIVDDIPTIESFGHSVTEGDTEAITGDALEGAVAGADADATFAWGANQSGKYGDITLNPDGTYSYTLDNDNAVVKDLSEGETLTEEFTYTYTDADGDVAEGKVTITINGVDNGVEVTPSDPSAESEVVTVYESGLDDGSQAGQASAPTTAEGSLSISAPDGVASIKIDGVTVFESGALTNNTVPTNEGVLTVTGFDAATGKLQFTYELTGNTTEHDGTGKDNISHDLAVTVTDMDGTTAGSTITVTIVDDVPSISVPDMSSTVVPGSGAGNLENGEAADFTKGAGGQPLGHSTSLSGWDGVTMYAAKVTYSGSGDNVQISGIDDSSDYTLKYSPYNTNHPDADKGLTVDAGNYSWWGNYDPTANHNEEISVIKDEDGKITQSEAVVFDLGGQLAYGVTIDFGAFYNGEPGATGTTQWDHVSEKALATFYRDGQIVGSTLVEGNSSDGKFTLNSSDVVLGGFDKVVISAVDNRTEEFKDENSDFTIQGIDFITKRDDPIIINEGTVTAVSGADGFADAYTDSHAKFDLAGMVNDGTLNEGGTSGTIMVLKDGTEQPVTLELSEGSSGESILTGTLADGEQLFTATLDKDGNWTMEQYEQFRVVGEEGESNQFGLIFKTEDADGDMASTTVNVPLEVVEQTITEDGAAIGNGDDTIVIEGGEGVAGTVAAGDSGGMTEGQQVAANYNVCFVLDTSGSMDERVGNEPAWWEYDTRPTRLDIAVESIENFIDTSIHQGDFVGTVNLAVVPFASTHGDTIKVSITRVSDGQGGYTETYTLGTSSYTTYDAFSTAFHSRLNRLDANGGTNYQAGFHNAAEWFGELDNPSGADGNITYFLSDGEPTFHGTSSEGGGNYAKLEDVQGAWTGYQELLGVASGMQVNAIGFGDDLDTNAMKTLAMLDNTGTPVSGVEGNQAADGYLYYGKQGTTKWPPDTGTITNGNATQVTDGAALATALPPGVSMPERLSLRAYRDLLRTAAVITAPEASCLSAPVLLEAMSCGVVPVLAGDAAGWPLLREGGGCLWCHAALLVPTLAAALGRPQELARLSRAARATVVRHFRRQDVIPGHLALLHAVRTAWLRKKQDGTTA